MLETLSPLSSLRKAILDRERTPLEIAEQVIANANGNASRNTYVHFDAESPVQQANDRTRIQGGPYERSPLYGIPISLKDCFDLAGTRTTCGSAYYASIHTAVTTDSAIAGRLKQTGALITGKTHLHPLAYGITGQNPDYGDCLQPRDATLLTGGSSSGAAASVQEGSALVGIGTDTGGSIRVPAALCGLVGFRASHSLSSASGWFPDAWCGGAHLSATFDTLGFLLRDPRDAAEIAHGLFHIPPGSRLDYPRIGYVPDSFLFDCEPEVLASFHSWQNHFASSGAILTQLDVEFWHDAFAIFAPIQAHEASILHQGNYNHFEESIRDRLHWGASLQASELASLHQRLQDFRIRINGLFAQFDFLMLPSAPVSRLPSNADLSSARQKILRYTTPFSLAGLPAISLPGELIGATFGTGVQVAAAPCADSQLLAFAESIGASLAS